MINYDGNNQNMRLAVQDYNKRMEQLLVKYNAADPHTRIIVLLFYATVYALISVIRAYDAAMFPADEQWFRHTGRENFLTESNALCAMVIRIESGIGGLSPDARARFLTAKTELRNIPEYIGKIPDMRIQRRIPTPPPPVPPEAFQAAQAPPAPQARESPCAWLCRQCSCVIL